jgi:ATP-dependent Clp protease ATP-binding subunit ClpC
MFERFSDQARRAIVLAQEEAKRLNHDYIGTEHILLGLLHDGENVAAKALQSLGVTLEASRQQVEEIIGRGNKGPSGQMPFTPRAKKVLELSLREAIHFHHDYIGTEHILLGLLREGEGVAVQVLVRQGADLNGVRLHVIQLLGQEGEAAGVPLAESVTREGAMARPAGPREFWLTEVQDTLAKIVDRLTAIERHLGMTTRPAESGDPPGPEPGDPPGQEPGDPPGQEAGDSPGQEPGDLPGSESGDPPGQEPGDPPGGGKAVGD